MRTQRMYYADPYARSFTAQVVARRNDNGKVGLVLDRTLFYPTSGGQPHDTGLLGGQPVLDVVEEGEEIVHLLPADVAGDAVEGIVDWQRRFDHMQQHTGQHILSQAFIRRLEAETVSFHLGDDYCTIDVAATGLTPTELASVEELANDVIFADTPIHADFVTPERLARLPLRKPPKVTENVRIVEVADFDWSPCGGTHCRTAGEVGIIKITHVERHGADTERREAVPVSARPLPKRREHTRVGFLCGGRALRDYRRLSEHLATLAAALSAHSDEAVTLALRGLEEAKAREKENQALRERLLAYEAAEILAAAPRRRGVAVVSVAFAEREFEEVKHLALRLAAGEKVVALLGTQGRKGQLVFARSADVPCDVNAVLQAACALIGGRGGGTPALAQGGAPEPDRIPEALAHARQDVEALLGQ